MKIKFFAILLTLTLLLTACVYGGETSVADTSSEASDISIESSADESPAESLEASEISEDTPLYPVREWCDIYSEQAFLYDSATNTMHIVKGCDADTVYPASITKLMTALTALKYLSPNTVITAGDELDLVERDASIAYILKGHMLTVSMLIEGMMLPSGGDAAYILAAAAGRVIAKNNDLPAGRAVETFVAEMNNTAKEYGMTGSAFKNPDGYEQDGHYTTMRDLAILAEAALACDEIMRYTRLESDSVQYASGHTNKWQNSNHLVRKESEHYRENAVGLKTGSTDQAGYCLLSAFEEADGSYIIIGTFACRVRENRFDDTLNIYDYYQENVKN